ncbi:hypothetical protein PENNAL_c0006G01371, partial [Penicillium nalgiovense]
APSMKKRTSLTVSTPLLAATATIAAPLVRRF